MTRVLVAGVGNVFLGDDGFGVAVARRLAGECLPEGTRVADFGIRGTHLVFELLDPPDLLILVDATARGGAPGTLYVIDPEIEAVDGHAGTPAVGHALAPAVVLATVRSLLGRLPRTRVVGCEPSSLTEGMELSPAVQRAVEPAALMVRRLIQSEVRS